MRNYKRCPRCNYKTPLTMKKCGKCGLNYDKFALATNSEAKSAFRMGEKERVLQTKNVPSDINKSRVLLTCILGGLFGCHYFYIGKKWNGLFQIIGLILGLVYSYVSVQHNIRTGFLGLLLLCCGFAWAATFIIWLRDIIAIIFNKFKYPVSLPYDSKAEKGE